MYEPIRTKSVHTMAVAPGIPHRSREEELDIRLAGQLTALLTVTDELHALTECGAERAALASAADRIAVEVARLSGHSPLRAEPTDGGDRSRVPALRQRAHTLAGNALAVATSRNDAGAVALAEERLAAHDASSPDLATA
ncbi:MULTISPECIES: hypothetical protein [Streptomyces]|uniref:Uncharacterized protein n=2 Tax=Streptomyces TaxID=1883 RepID=A0A2N8PDW2_STRNR|nr:MULTISPECIES: hypothetical protein [Streptomyces]PNE39203.1 hypothetical protein AOB60_35440 [Streptomyces noursei]SHL28348.1 hypothetical protein SAMN05216268_103466 [Streptomyces yunnanensis]